MTFFLALYSSCKAIAWSMAFHRPALVISSANYNGKTGLMVCCPMTSKIQALLIIR
jgi:mRNA-degrading endonuclease toxin of MazEF toxin-antitoxin module